MSTYLLDQLHQLGTLAESQRANIEAECDLPKDLVDRLKRSGILRLWTAADYGGQQAELKALTQAIETLAYYEGSLSWVAMVTGTASLISGYLSPEAGSNVFSQPDAMLGGWAAPAGVAQRQDGGILVNGRWGWGSGTPHCTTIVGGVRILSPESESGARPQIGLAFFDPADVIWHNNWNVNGLNGTASGDYEVQNLFVPHQRWIPFPVQTPTINAPLYRISFYGALAAGVASVAIGLAVRAVDEIKKLGLTKKPALSRKTLAENPVIRHQLAENEAKLGAARAYLNAMIDAHWAAAQQGVPAVKTRQQLRLAATYAVQQCSQVVDWAYKAGGGSTIWNGVKLQELQRDIQVATQHGLIAPSNYELLGRVAFEQPINPWIL